MKINKAFAILFLFMFSVSGVAIAETNDCIGLGCGNVTGSMKISTFAVGGGIDADGIIANSGAAGGISGAGGLTSGQASGFISTYTTPIYGWYQDSRGRWKFGQTGTRTYAGGTVEASLNTIGGGLTKTEAYAFNKDGVVGVGSASDNYAVTGADLDIRAFGVAAVEGCVFGFAGQGSLDGSIMLNNGVSYGIAGQYSAGYFAGAAGVAGFGSAGVDARIDMVGNSYSESYRGVFVDGPSTTRVLGTNVGATTGVTSYGDTYDKGISESYLTGGWQASGMVTSKTIQLSDGGFTKAEANGSYSGAGSLGCNFEGSAVGGTQTSSTTVNNYNGSVMTSSSNMKVSAKTGGSGSIAK